MLYSFVNNNAIGSLDLFGKKLITTNCDKKIKEELEKAYKTGKDAVNNQRGKDELKCCLEKAGVTGNQNPAERVAERLRAGGTVSVICVNCINEDACGFVCNEGGIGPAEQCKIPGIQKDQIYICNGRSEKDCPRGCTLFHELIHQAGDYYKENLRPAAENCFAGCRDK